MSIKLSRADQGAERARLATIAIANELRGARIAAGLSQSDAGRAAGLSGSQVSRLERGQIAKPQIDQLSRLGAVLGQKLSLKLYPEGSAVRDGGQLALLSRLEQRLAGRLILRREAGLPIQGDQRAWDGRIDGGGRRCAVEAEVHLKDLQDVSRRIALKLRDDPTVDRVILLVARSAHNRHVLREHREALRGQFPLEGAGILACLRRGEVPAASGILML